MLGNLLIAGIAGLATGVVTSLAEGYGFLEVPRWHARRLWTADMLTGHVLALAAGRPAWQLAVPVWARFGPAATATRTTDGWSPPGPAGIPCCDT